MRTINISKKRLKELMPLKLSKGTINTESKIYEFNYLNEDKLLKYLYTRSGEVFANKLYTVEMLDANKRYLPLNFCIPDCLASVNNETIGFTIPKIDGVNLNDILENTKIDLNEKIEYLKEVGSILERLDSIRNKTPLKDLFIGDLHASNFVVNPDNRTVYVVDLDSCKIANNRAIQAKYLNRNALLNLAPNKYQFCKDTSLAYVVPDKNTDLYCYNIMILEYLYGGPINNIGEDEFYNYITYLESIGLDKHLIRSFLGLIENRNNENPMYWLYTLTYEQVARSKQIAYSKKHK